MEKTVCDRKGQIIEEEDKPQMGKLAVLFLVGDHAVIQEGGWGSQADIEGTFLDICPECVPKVLDALVNRVLLHAGEKYKEQLQAFLDLAEPDPAVSPKKTRKAREEVPATEALPEE